jgi:hypothetical protein
MHDSILTLLPTNNGADFTRNFRELERASKRPYSLLAAIQKSTGGRRLDGMEGEVSAELQKLSGRSGTMIPMQALTRDLTVGSTPVVQTTVGSDPLPFLRNRAACLRLGGRVLEDLPRGNLSLPRQTATGGVAWLPEVGGVTPTNALFDSVNFSPARLCSATIISSQLLAQSSVALDAYIGQELSIAAAHELDRVALCGTGVAPQPLGILNTPANVPSGTAYNKLAPSVTFGGPASWDAIQKFIDSLESCAVYNDDDTFGWVIAPDVRSKLARAAVTTGYPRFLLEKSDTEPDPRIAGYKCVSTAQLPSGSVIFGKWSELLLATWPGLELLTNHHTLAHKAEISITLTMFCATALRYACAFCIGSDSGAQLSAPAHDTHPRSK